LSAVFESAGEDIGDPAIGRGNGLSRAGQLTLGFVPRLAIESRTSRE
jgi:hypothetical protein